MGARRSGLQRTTPAKVFFLGEDGVVALTYGPQADWVQNVLLSGGTVEHQGTVMKIVSVEVIDRDASIEQRCLNSNHLKVN